MSPPPPPDPPEYGPSKPPRGREDTGIGRAAPTTALIVDKLEELNTLLRNRAEQSDIRNEDTESLRLRVKELLEEDRKRRSDDDFRRARATRNRRLFWSVGTAVGLIAAAAVAAYQQSQPKPPSIENVQETIEARTTELEENSEETTRRLDNVDRKVQRLGEELVETKLQWLDGIGYLGKKLDAVSPRAEKVPEPETLKEGRKKAEKLRRERDLRRLFDDPADDSTPR